LPWQAELGISGFQIFSQRSAYYVPIPQEKGRNNKDYYGKNRQTPEERRSFFLVQVSMKNKGKENGRYTKPNRGQAY
jgi:hypothetical protein